MTKQMFLNLHTVYNNILHWVDIYCDGDFIFLINF